MLTKKTAKISPAGIEFIKGGEGHYGKVYDDLSSKTPKYSWGPSWAERNFKGTPTIGYGHVVWSKWVDERSRWTDYLHSGGSFLTKQQAHDLLVSDIPKYERRVRSYLSDKARFSQNMWDALISMAYNTGAGATAIKNIVKAINEGKYEEAADIMRGGPKKTRDKRGKLIYLRGLSNRRNKEADLFLKDSQQIHGLGLLGVLGLTGISTIIGYGVTGLVRYILSEKSA